ncbi:MAG: AEC family transporter [Pseudomonadota bacterium]
MLKIFLLVLPIFLVLLTGNLLMRLKLMTADFISVASRLIFNVCLPVLLFYKISASRFDEVYSPMLILTMGAAVTLMFALSFAAAYILRLPKKSAGTFAMNNFRANYAYMGLPVCFYAYGEQGLAIASIFMAFIVPYVNMLSVLALSLSAAKAFDRKLFLKNTLLNPIAVSCLIGIGFSVFSIPVPAVIATTLNIISGITLPLSLFAIGATTNMALLRGSMGTVAISTGLKLIGLPLLALLFLKAAGTPVTLPDKVMIIMLSAPCATINYVLASVMEGDTDIASGTIVASTLLSILSFVGWLHYLSI